MTIEVPMSLFWMGAVPGNDNDDAATQILKLPYEIQTQGLPFGRRCLEFGPELKLKLEFQRLHVGLQEVDQ